MQNGPVMNGRQPKPGRHLLPAQSGGHRVPPARSRRALKARKEAMSGISRWPELKPCPAI
jgi:hypothetical protein